MFRLSDYKPRHTRRHAKATWLMRLQCWANLYFALRVV